MTRRVVCPCPRHSAEPRCFVCGRPATHLAEPIIDGPVDDAGRPLCTPDPRCDAHELHVDPPLAFRRRRKAAVRRVV